MIRENYVKKLIKLIPDYQCDPINSAFKSIQDEREFKLLGSELFDILKEELNGQYEVIYES